MKYRNKPVEVEAITFDDLVQHGRDTGGNIVNGMPWSFEYAGWHVTHENDELYLICRGPRTLRFRPDHMLITQEDGELATCPRDVFLPLYEPVP
jgi:mannose-6-phosphate isomerase-like protein (cupin superfamily)